MEATPKTTTPPIIIQKDIQYSPDSTDPQSFLGQRLCIAVQRGNAASMFGTIPKTTLRIWLDVGHTYAPRRWASGRAVAEEWRVWVRGVAGADISAVVDKVMFQLHPDTQFPFPKRIFLEPPYQIQDAGSVPSEIQIDVFLKCCTKPDRIEIKYCPFIKDNPHSTADSQCFYHDIHNPTKELQKAILESKPTNTASDSLLIVLPDSGEVELQTHEIISGTKRDYEDTELSSYNNNKKIKLLNASLL